MAVVMSIHFSVSLQRRRFFSNMWGHGLLLFSPGACRCSVDVVAVLFRSALVADFLLFLFFVGVLAVRVLIQVPLRSGQGP